MVISDTTMITLNKCLLGRRSGVEALDNAESITPPFGFSKCSGTRSIEVRCLKR